MTLRPAGIADLDVILHHRREMFREMGGEYERQLDAFEGGSRTYFESALKDGSYYGLMGELNGAVIAGGGIVIAQWPGSPLNFEPRRAWILNLYVEPGYRRKGYARTITQSLIEWSKEQGFQSVALHASEYGHSLYEKLGFRGTNEMRLKF
jgi:ribosomal protein S18 acetylase RimI-like enzyme